MVISAGCQTANLPKTLLHGQIVGQECCDESGTVYIRDVLSDVHMLKLNHCYVDTQNKCDWRELTCIALKCSARIFHCYCY